MLAGHALALVGVPMRRVLRVVQAQREARYQLLRGYFHGWDDDTLEEMEEERLNSVTLPLGAYAVGRTLDELALHALQVEVLQWRADNGATTHEIDEQRPLEGGDTLVLFGRPTPLELAQDKLLKG